MKKFLLNIIMILLLGGTLTGCADFGDLNKDPNEPTATDNRYLFIDASRYVRYFHIVGTYNPFPQHFSHYWAERQNVQYTVLNLNSFSVGANYYQRILNALTEIVRSNQDEKTVGSALVSGLGTSENQIAVAETLTGFVYMHLTDVLGMIPYSEALQGKAGNFTPKYDTQEEIYADLDRRLTEAYKMFNTAGKFNDKYDIFYKGDINKWKKFNASVRMLLAIKMTKADPVNGKKRFAAAYADGGILNNADNFNYYYLSESDNENPLYNNIFVGKRDDFAPTTTIMDVLKEHNDPVSGRFIKIGLNFSCF
jgi:Starch-binding associating with outer membrane